MIVHVGYVSQTRGIESGGPTEPPCRATGGQGESPPGATRELWGELWGELRGKGTQPKEQAYEIPRWVPAIGESVRNRPEVTPKVHVAAEGR